MAVNEGPLLVSERLEYWRPSALDLEEIYAIVTEPETARFIGRRESIADQFERSTRNAGSWLLYGYGCFTLRPRGGREIIGTAGVFHSWRGLGEDVDDRPEIGWILRRDQVGRGLGFEAASTSLAWFDAVHGRHTVTCFVAADNKPSLALAEKLGFTVLREARWPGGEIVKVLVRSASGEA